MMKKLLTLTFVAALFVVANVAARADTYPSRPVTIIVPFAPGGATDAIARIVGRWLQPVLGQSVVVENVAGAGSTLGTQRVADAAKDGYTLLIGTSSAMVIGPHLYKNLRYDTFKSFSAIGLISDAPFVVLVNEKGRFKTFADLVAYGKANPGKLNFATPGAGTTQHLSLTQIFSAAGITGAAIPFKGTAPGMTALMAGEVDVLIETPNGALPMIEGQKLRAIAVTLPKRLESLPNVPSLSELGIDVEARAWFGMLAPAGTPEPVLTKLRTALRDALNNPELVAAMRATGLEATPSTHEAFEALMAKEFKEYGRVIKEMNLSFN